MKNTKRQDILSIKALHIAGHYLSTNKVIPKVALIDEVLDASRGRRQDHSKRDLKIMKRRIYKKNLEVAL